MINLLKDCKLHTVSEENMISSFDCSNEDLNDFFNNKAFLFKEQLLAMTCFFRHEESRKVVCAFSLSPNALKAKDLPNNRQNKVKQLVPREKTLQSYPVFW